MIAAPWYAAQGLRMPSDSAAYRDNRSPTLPHNLFEGLSNVRAIVSREVEFEYQAMSRSIKVSHSRFLSHWWIEASYP